MIQERRYKESFCKDPVTIRHSPTGATAPLHWSWLFNAHIHVPSAASQLSMLQGWAAGEAKAMQGDTTLTAPSRAICTAAYSWWALLELDDCIMVHNTPWSPGSPLKEAWGTIKTEVPMGCATLVVLSSRRLCLSPDGSQASASNPG